MHPSTRRAALSGARTFLPTDIAGLKLWLDASRITGLADGDPVGTWSDLSGNGNDATQATGSKKPTYKTNIFNSKPVVRFDGVDDFLSFTTSDLPAFTVFLVFKATSKAGFGGPLCLRTATQHGFNLASDEGSASAYTPHLTLYDGSAETVNKKGPTTYSFPTITMLQVYQDSPAYYLNSHSEALANGTNGFAATGGNVGRGYQNGYFGADMAEVLIYSATLSTTERQRVESYLNSKYAIY
jgi:hypothetical protein